MDSKELRERTKKMAARVIKFVELLPKGAANDVMGRQLIPSVTSVAANYRAACRSRSPADFINKLGIVEEESDETLFWLELIVESGKASYTQVALLLKEAEELVRIFSASRLTAKRNRNQSSAPRATIANRKS